MSDSNGHSRDKGFERDLRPPKPCCKRIAHEGVSQFETSITWCTEPDGHPGQCSGPFPTVIENNRGRRR